MHTYCMVIQTSVNVRMYVHKLVISSNTTYVTDVLKISKGQNTLKFVGKHLRFKGKLQKFCPLEVLYYTLYS